MNKEVGLGEVKSKSELSDFDMAILNKYFTAAMAGLPNPQLLQDIMIFHILFYMCRRGRENLRNMTKNTFGVKVDPENGRKFIYQAIDEADKNHTYHDTSKTNDRRIYETPGTNLRIEIQWQNLCYSAL